MKAILVIELDDDVNLEEVEIRYAIQDMYGMPVKAEVDGCPLKPLPQKQEHREGLCSDYILGFEDGWNDCLEEITGETQWKLQVTEDLK